jgi:hypothetical protein
LIEHIERNPDFVLPGRYRNELLSMLRGEVLGRSLHFTPTRALSWGIELPLRRQLRHVRVGRRAHQLRQRAEAAAATTIFRRTGRRRSISSARMS